MVMYQQGRLGYAAGTITSKSHWLNTISFFLTLCVQRDHLPLVVNPGTHTDGMEV